MQFNGRYFEKDNYIVLKFSHYITFGKINMYDEFNNTFVSVGCVMNFHCQNTMTTVRTGKLYIP